MAMGASRTAPAIYLGQSDDDPVDLNQMYASGIAISSSAPTLRPAFHAPRPFQWQQYIYVELPGVEKDDIVIEFRDGVLDIVGKRYEVGGVKFKEEANITKRKDSSKDVHRHLFLQYHLRYQPRVPHEDTGIHLFRPYENGLLVLSLPNRIVNGTKNSTARQETLKSNCARQNF